MLIFYCFSFLVFCYRILSFKAETVISSSDLMIFSLFFVSFCFVVVVFVVVFVILLFSLVFLVVLLCNEAGNAE